MEMKHEAVAFDYPNDVKPANYNDIKYGDQHVPRPTNSHAKMTDHAKVMSAVLEAK